MPFFSCLASVSHVSHATANTHRNSIRLRLLPAPFYRRQYWDRKRIRYWPRPQTGGKWLGQALASTLGDWKSCTLNYLGLFLHVKLRCQCLASELTRENRDYPKAQWVKNPPTMQETQEMWVWSLDREDLLEEENGNPLQYSSLLNPMDRGAWQATVQWVTKSQTRLSD